MVTSPAVTTQAVAVSKRYGRTLPWVLRDVDLTVTPGRLTVIVGANGSGKSTLMKVFAGVIRPSFGAITGRPEVGYVPERLPERVRMTGRVYLSHMARLRGMNRSDANRRSESLAEAFGLDPGLDTPITALSKGNRQKVCLAQALLAPVGLLVLDEPWSGLDALADEGLRRELASARRAGTSVIATAHRVGAVADADETFVLSDGHLELSSLEGTRTDTARVELMAPAGADDKSAFVPWTAGIPARRSGELWQLTVDGESVDSLLAAALRAGWSVHRVDPDPESTTEQGNP